MLEKRMMVGIIVIILLAMPVFSATSYWNAENRNLSIANTLFVDSGSRYVGIGTINPDVKLHLQGSGNSDASIKLDQTGTNGDSWQILSTNSAHSGGGGNLAFYNNDVSAYRFYITSDGDVGIGTTNPNKKLTVMGDANITGEVYSNGELVSGIPSGAVMFFNLESCPSGWNEFTSARGRYIVGMPSSGTLSGTAGTALTNLENRPVGQHSHSVNPPSTTTSSNGAHTHTVPFRNMDNPVDGNILEGRDGTNTATKTTSSAGTHSHTIDIASFESGTSGTVTGTNAPYIQLLVCQKD